MGKIRAAKEPPCNCSFQQKQNNKTPLGDPGLAFIFPVASAASGDLLVTWCTKEICATAPFLSLRGKASRSAINSLFPWDFIPLKSRGVFALPPASQTLEQALKLVFNHLNPIQVLKRNTSYWFLVSRGCEQSYVKDRAQGLESKSSPWSAWGLRTKRGLQTYLPAPDPMRDPHGELVNEVLWCLSPESALSGFGSISRSLSLSSPRLCANRKGEGEVLTLLGWHGQNAEGRVRVRERRSAPSPQNPLYRTGSRWVFPPLPAGELMLAFYLCPSWLLIHLSLRRKEEAEVSLLSIGCCCFL